MNEQQLRRGLEQLVELAAQMAMTSRVYEEYARYSLAHKGKPNHLVVAPDVYHQLLFEADSMGGIAWRDFRGAALIFGMEIEVAGLPDGEFFVGEHR